MKIGRIFIISGPSGSGKTTFYKKLLSTRKELVKSVSVTTREKRSGEKNGIDYVFVSKKMFFYKVKAGHFLESEKVFDNYYGTPNKNVRDILKSGKNVLLCIDVKGAKAVRRKFPDLIGIFIKAPSLEVLKKRLIDRGSEKSKVVRLRLKMASSELKEAKSYDYVVINDDFNKAYESLEKIIDYELNKTA